MQPLAKRGGWKYGFGDLISKAEGDLTIRGVEFSEVGEVKFSEVGEVKFSEGTRFLSRATLFFYKRYFCGKIVINYSYHYLHSKMILENDSTILNMCFVRFLGGAPTSIYHFFRPSIRPSVAHHISGTILHLIIIFGTLV